jgi:hypothetical protein
MKTLWIALAAALFGALLALVLPRLTGDWPFGSRGTVTHSALGEEILVMRTRGGLLEVSQIRAQESFDTKYVYTLLGVPVAETVPRIRVPAHYRYHIELAPEWKVWRNGDLFMVVVPAVRPSLPVAVDLGKMEKDVAGTWMLLPFTGDVDVDALERTLTKKLAEKAMSPAYIQMQRESARRTVEEFVKKWLVTQQQWQSADRPMIQVWFADEPMGSVDAFKVLRYQSSVNSVR